jgi:hypothetical protein
MEPEGSLPCSKEPSTGPYPKPDQSNPYHLILVHSSEMSVNLYQTIWCHMLGNTASNRCENLRSGHTEISKLSFVWVTIDGVWIGDWIYWTLTDCNYK